MITPKDFDRTSVSSTSDGTLLSQISSNPFFTGGLGLVVLGTAVATSQRGIRLGALALKRWLLISMEITHKDRPYPHVLRWIRQHQNTQIQTTSSRLSLRDRLLSHYHPRIHNVSYSDKEVPGSHGTTQTDFALVSGVGRHYLRYKNTFILVERQRSEKSMDLTTGKMWETIQFTTLYSQRHIFDAMLKEVLQLDQQSTEGKTTLYTPTMVDWSCLGEPTRKRPLSSVILDKGVSEGVVKDMQAFLASEATYRSRGVPYRRGYLLHGTPGTGKTSFVQALAGQFNFNIAMLSLSERGLTDARLARLFVNVPPKTVILIEDVDAAFQGREQSDEHGYQGAYTTFSGLLNALDGLTASNDRIIFLTTNHVDRLDPALVRPGRVDMTIHFGDATRHQAQEMWERFYPPAEHDDVAKNEELKESFLDFLEKTHHVGPDATQPISTAVLQGLFLRHSDPENVMEAAQRYFDELGLTGNAGDDEKQDEVKL